MVRALGLLMFTVGGAATAYATWAAYTRGRPADVLFGVLAPIALLVAVLGLVVAFVPGFLS